MLNRAVWSGLSHEPLPGFQAHVSDFLGAAGGAIYSTTYGAAAVTPATLVISVTDLTAAVPKAATGQGLNAYETFEVVVTGNNIGPKEKPVGGAEEAG